VRFAMASRCTRRDTKPLLTDRSNGIAPLVIDAFLVRTTYLTLSIVSVSPFISGLLAHAVSSTKPLYSAATTLPANPIVEDRRRTSCLPQCQRNRMAISAQ
jgi:hypothetical protein